MNGAEINGGAVKQTGERRLQRPDWTMAKNKNQLADRLKSIASASDRARNKDQVSNRLESIAGAKPVEFTTKAAKSAGKPEREQRKDVFRTGKIYTSRDAFLPCIIRDLSENGARLRMEADYGLPEIIVLRIDQTGVVIKSKVIWREDNDIGLQFIEDLTRKRANPNIRRKPIASDFDEGG